MSVQRRALLKHEETEAIILFQKAQALHDSNFTEAAKLYQASGAAGYPNAYYVYAKTVIDELRQNADLTSTDRSNFQGVVNLLNVATTYNHVEAIYYMAVLCKEEWFMALEDVTFKWFLRAAELEHTEAQYEVACMYESGTGTPADRRQAFFWLSRAGLKDHSEALAKLKLLTAAP